MMNRYKGFLYIILSIILLSGISLFAYTQKVYDEANLLTSSEITTLNQRANELSQSLNMDIVIVTTLDNQGKTSRDYADDFYDYNGFGFGPDRDGLLLLFNMDDREVYISTAGIAIRYLTDQRIERILDAVDPHLSSANYYEGVVAFLNNVEGYIRAGIPSNQHTVEEKKPNILGRIVMYLFISMGIGGIAVGVMASNNKGKSTVNEGTYLQNKALNIISSNDRHVNTRVTHVTINTNSGSGSSGGSSGRSTVHRSSSGRSHGGGGRKF
ncbi:uncharacterized protein EDC18_11049 [Natranaerovirga pectinivora]|uniref:TPM domain-containing protein n=1 Tax=Natranaerovirga pectinivora TaxID=682400 RepID=A0A4R3MI66_9FIRM|nr:TPM domain-containing protein [Natranaerovirga pectinivora]TCT12975.1 uncharacterized protein EDC18_11049 [Natranaerovirga pectinivora]